uniref:DNA-(apurinic or apyrimidinic site) lyase n=1 Tax=Odontella aurita TaxID=265563 RepID=A0A6U6FTQ8_9STRA|mmetsp:Transcript_37944/g.113356  ORF Transcript_37944/g.113356 Transcript_37944/m.113356 type:complete len:575 (+) Transcript_37944:168-1892(+)
MTSICASCICALLAISADLKSKGSNVISSRTRYCRGSVSLAARSPAHASVSSIERALASPIGGKARTMSSQVEQSFVRRSTRKRCATSFYVTSFPQEEIPEVGAPSKPSSRQKRGRRMKNGRRKAVGPKMKISALVDFKQESKMHGSGRKSLNIEGYKDYPELDEKGEAAKSPSNTKDKTSKANLWVVSKDLEAIAPERPWTDLRISPDELRPSATLTTGQCFNWIVVQSDRNGLPSGDDGGVANMAQKSAWGTHDATEWVGPLRDWVFCIRETSTTTLFRVLHGTPKGAEEYLRRYFQLETQLVPLYNLWSESDSRLSKIAAAIPGVRVVRQDPKECLFSFICSSNNNIPRITLMLSRLREKYGVHLMEVPARTLDSGGVLRSGEKLKIYSFPTLAALAPATDIDLRAMGLGYRAKYIAETTKLLNEVGGEDFLFSLRKSNASFVQEELIKFSGIGRKVADCVALFSLDQIEAIPVDVHVEHIARRNYDPTLVEVKSLTPTVYKRVGNIFRRRFSSHAGWAHSLLFVAELPSFRPALPGDIVEEMDLWRQQELARKAAKRAEKAAKVGGKSAK